MKYRALIGAIAIAATVAASAKQTEDSPAIIQSIERGNITIVQPAGLSKLLMRVETPEESAEETEQTPGAKTAHASRTGYRVQVFDDNNPRTARKEAESRHALIQKEFPSLRSYVTFSSPYWRVKVGDFRTRAEAEAAMAELRHAFPSMGAYMRIVRDKINTYE